MSRFSLCSSWCERNVKRSKCSSSESKGCAFFRVKVRELGGEEMPIESHPLGLGQSCQVSKVLTQTLICRTVKGLYS